MTEFGSHFEPESGIRPPTDEELRHAVEFVQETMADTSKESDFAERDLVATMTVERAISGQNVAHGTEVVGDVLGVQDTESTNPFIVLGNVVFFKESEESVRTILATYEILSIPFYSVSDLFLTHHTRHGACVGDSWHKDHFPSPD